MSLRSQWLRCERRAARGEADPRLPKVLVALHARQGQVHVRQGRGVDLLVLGRLPEVLDPAEEVVAEQQILVGVVDPPRGVLVASDEAERAGAILSKSSRASPSSTF